jgi:hypothetical protein
VQSPEGRPIEDASVSLFSTSKPVGKNGCFSFNLADAPPFTLSATAKGYLPFECKVKYGTYHVTIILEPIGSQTLSKATWRKISSDEFAREKKLPLDTQPGCVSSDFHKLTIPRSVGTIFNPPSSILAQNKRIAVKRKRAGPGDFHVQKLAARN